MFDENKFLKVFVIIFPLCCEIYFDQTHKVLLSFKPYFILLESCVMYSLTMKRLSFVFICFMLFYCMLKRIKVSALANSFAIRQNRLIFKSFFFKWEIFDISFAKNLVKQKNLPYRL